MRKVITILTIVLLVLMNIGGCSKKNLNNQLSKNGSFKVKSIINQNVSQNLSSTKSNFMRNNLEQKTEDNIELWVMPTRRGTDSIIYQGNVTEIRKFKQKSDGSFDIATNNLPDTTFVVFIVDNSDSINFKILSFLSLKIDNKTSVIEFPSSYNFTGDIEFGNVVYYQSQYTSTSQYSLSENKESFNSASLKELQDSANFQNAILATVNILNNAKLKDSELNYYVPNISVRYSSTTLNDLKNAQSSDEINWGNLGVYVYSHDSTTKAKLFTPNGEKSFGYYGNNGYNSATKWYFSIPWEDFRNYAKPNQLWELRSETGEILAKFDMSVTIILDNKGNPIIPIPIYDFNTDNNTMTFNWFYFEQDGITRTEITDINQLNNMISTEQFWLLMKDYNGTYMFRDSSGGSFGGMKGNLYKIDEFTPKIDKSILTNGGNFGYRFGLYSAGGIYSSYEN